MTACDSQSKPQHAGPAPDGTDVVEHALHDDRQTSPSVTAAATTLTDSEQAGLAQAELKRAELGKPAPDFSLMDIAGLQVRLKDFLGKPVVLEWFNPQCPFVRLSHTKGSLKDAPRRHADAGVVWLAINSAAPGNQGHAPEINRKAKIEFDMSYPLLVDEDGTVGRMYDARRTPHLYVIDPNGILIYRGAIDNSPDGEGASPQGGKLVRYVDQALTELAAGKTVSVPETEAYGCSVKYGN